MTISPRFRHFKMARSVVTLLAMITVLTTVTIAAAQAPADPADDTTAGPVSTVDATSGNTAATTTDDSTSGKKDEGSRINLLELLLAGGYFMIPIGAMSLLVVTFSLERILGLRRSKVLPSELITELGLLSSERGGLDPRKAFKTCQSYPSAASSVIKAMLLKVGRPHSELENAVKEANEREAARLYSNVRWLSLAATVTPLLGLLGTVWGILIAFHDTANLPPEANKADFLARGIYIALVTTLAGLCVAIPAAILAHAFEGRIQTIFRQLEEILLGMMPQLERFEGRMRVSHEQMTAPAPSGAPVSGGAPPQQKPGGPPPGAGGTSKSPPPPQPPRTPQSG